MHPTIHIWGSPGQLSNLLPRSAAYWRNSLCLQVPGTALQCAAAPRRRRPGAVALWTEEYCIAGTGTGTGLRRIRADRTISQPQAANSGNLSGYAGIECLFWRNLASGSSRTQPNTRSGPISFYSNIPFPLCTAVSFPFHRQQCPPSSC